MRRSKLLEPRKISPELVEIGDTVRVTFEPVQGIVRTREAIVHRRIDENGVRAYFTKDGGLIFTWKVGKKHGYIIHVLDREPQEQQTLFDM
jgi:hypothetical protein